MNTRARALVRCFLPLLASSYGMASNLTVCGIADGGAGDPDATVNGTIAATCGFPQGSFTGTVTDAIQVANSNYAVSIAGIFRGVGSFTVQGLYSAPVFPLDNIHWLYPWIGGGGRLVSDGGGVSGPTDFLRFSDGASSPEVRPVLIGVPLPVGLTSGIGVGQNRPITTPQAYQLTITFSSGGADRYFDVGMTYAVDTNLVPEPSSAWLCLPAIGALLLLRRPGAILSS